MEEVDFHAITHADPTPTLLIQTDGLILAANPAAREIFAGPRKGGGENLLHFVEDAPETARAYLGRCAGTRDGVLGALTFKAAKGAPARFRCDGALARSATGASPAIVVLRCREIGAAHEKFLALTETIAELHAEIHLRSRTQHRLEAALLEKEILLKEVHHRVKNNLQVIAGIFSMAIARETDDRVRLRLSEASNRVQAMATVQKLLYQSDELSRLDASQLLVELCDSVGRSYDLPNIRTIVDVSCKRLSLESATPIGLIVNELLTNAFKHAFPDNRPGTVRVSLTTVSDGRLRLEISDDGVGPRTGARGMGLTLVEGLALQLQGELQIEGDPGMRITLMFVDANDLGDALQGG